MVAGFSSNATTRSSASPEALQSSCKVVELERKAYKLEGFRKLPVDGREVGPLRWFLLICIGLNETRNICLHLVQVVLVALVV